MNEFLEQLVRVLTNAYSRSQKKIGERVSPGSTNQRSYLSLPCCWGTIAIKRLPLIHLDCLCSVSLPISVFFTHSLLVVLRKGHSTILNAAAYSLCLDFDIFGKLLSPNHLWSLPAAPYSDLSARQYKEVFQDLMFDRLLNSTLSEDASEVLVQLLHCSTEKANSVARVVVKLTPRLCSRCASNTLIHSGGAGLMILLNVSLIFFWAKERSSAPLMFQPAEYLRLKVCPSCCKWCFSPLYQVLLAPFSPDFPICSSASSRPAGKIITFLQISSYLLCERLRHRKSLMSSHLLRNIYQVLGIANQLASSFCLWFSQDSAPSQP